MRTLTLILFVVGTAFACFAQAAERIGDALVFKLPVVPQSARHLDLLASPAYLAVALEANGLGPSLSSRMVLRDAGTIEIRTASVHFVERKGAVFRYDGRLSLAVSGVGPSLNVPVEVDTGAIESGNVTIRVFVPLSGMLPAELLDRIEQKLRLLADLDAQRRVVAYLDEAKQRSSGGGPEALREALIFDAYNRGSPTVGGGCDVGGATPVSEQIALIVTLVIWGLGIPGLLWWARRRRRRTPFVHG